MIKKKKSPAPAPAVKIGSPFQFIDDMFKDYVRPAESSYPFDFLVAVCGRVDSPGPRDSRWEYILDYGMPLLEKVLKKEPIGPGPHYFIFPDRWLVPGEAAAFSQLLSENPDAKKFKRVYIITHQPYLVSGCKRENCRIVRKE